MLFCRDRRRGHSFQPIRLNLIPPVRDYSAMENDIIERLELALANVREFKACHETLDFFSVLPDEIVLFIMEWIDERKNTMKMLSYTCHRLNDAVEYFIIDKVMKNRTAMDIVLMIDQAGARTFQHFLMGVQFEFHDPSVKMQFTCANVFYRRVMIHRHTDINRDDKRTTIKSGNHIMMFIAKPKVDHYFSLVNNVLSINAITTDMFKACKNYFIAIPTGESTCLFYNNSAAVELGLDYLVLQQLRNNDHFLRMFAAGRLPIRTPEEFAVANNNYYRSTIIRHYKQNYRRCEQLCIGL